MLQMTIQENIASVTEESVMSLADNMAAAATSFNAHGYDSFIQSREQFKIALHRLFARESTTTDIKQYRRSSDKN